MDIKIIKLKDRPELKEKAAEWFHEKWGVPESAYLESINECIKGKSPVPQWYVVQKDGSDRIIAGMGVIENDFHSRKDLSPNICAVYTEEDMRRYGIAGRLLGYVCDDMKSYGIDTLYLVTDHTSFYERYGWEFLYTVQEDSGGMTRMYVHRE